MRKHLVTGLAALGFAAFLFPGAALAQDGDPVNGGFGVGLGWGSVEDADSSALALVQYRGEVWEVEFDYLFGDDTAWALHGDYIFNFERDYDTMDSGAYVGAGWSFVNVNGGDEGTTGGDDDENSSNGFNVLIGYDFSSEWSAEARWALLDADLITLTATYNFGSMDGGGDDM
ncbi:MAG TPA: hypothetical protein VEI97_09640 [bacterium]|nr:hypothetical protein [bacterium]